MKEDPVLHEAAEWFKKLNNPASGTYRIAHARHDNSAPPFNPEEVLREYRETSEVRMSKLCEAVELIGQKADSK